MKTTDKTTPSTAALVGRLVVRQVPPGEVALATRRIYESVLRQSAWISTGNFTSAADSDLALLFDLYDEHFFAGDLRKLVRVSGAPLTFTLSSRLTRSAGLTKRFAPRSIKGLPPAAAKRYEISLS